VTDERVQFVARPLAGEVMAEFRRELGRFAGQTVGIEEVHDDIWLVNFMDYDLGYFDLGYFDLGSRALRTTRKSLRPKSATCVLGTSSYPCLRLDR
jgi:hypothetical protein